MKVSGQCLCGKSKFTATLKEKHFDACHCSMCRKWAGSSLMVVNASEGLEFEDDKFVTLYDSSDWAERGFCGNCGSNLFYRTKDGSYTGVPYGLLDDQEGFDFTMQIFVERKPSTYDFANKTKTMTGDEVFAAFAKKD
ncbi:MAG: aldehyde-activating protein [Bdellovibrionaceae bacterium]|nr:aldehyde-activating protein [Pseudobdellovibrionaceae bacterium]|tara:strand:- start:807 stop:1220 length:414 start_codon:yes stop_codon:yes gene_type:complete